MHRIMAVMMAATACVSMAQAKEGHALQSVSAPMLTLEQAIEAALGNAPAMDAAQAGERSAESARRIAGLRPNPTLETQVENVVGSGPYGGFSQAETTTGFSVPIELGRKRSARIAAADAQSGRARLATALSGADVRLQTTLLYIDAVAAERRAETARDQLRIAIDAANVARLRVQAGRASPLEAQRAEVARVNAEAMSAQAERLVQTGRRNLARRTGLDDSARLDAAMLDRLGARAYGPSDVQSAGTLALAAADADLAVADADVRLARSQRMPDVTVGPAVRRLEATKDTAAVLALSVPIPLFNAGRAAVDQASAERNRAQAQRRMTALDVEQAMADAQTEVDNAATLARAAQGPALTAAQEAARIARIGYREGKFGQIDLLDAERTLAETRLAAIDALAAYQNARAQLERLTAPAPERGD